jgi:flavin reductase (DIM6/NTAB) family NADH-FMN oxidoreductase RutF
MNITEGHFDGTDLSGLKWAATVWWPGALHDGNGATEMFIDESASEGDAQHARRCGPHAGGTRRLTARSARSPDPGTGASPGACYGTASGAGDGRRGRQAAAPTITIGGLSEVLDLFREAMASLASGVAVVTARRSDGHPCGLAVTSVSSFSAHPPSLLVSVAHSSRCHEALAESEHFGVHILGTEEEPLARVFAGKGDDKFGGLDWGWDGGVPELGGTIAYLRCRRSANFERYDHTILIGDLEGGRIGQGEPLLYARRRMDWLLRGIE